MTANWLKPLAFNQVNFKRFYELVDEWEDHEKIRFIIAAGECGYAFDIEGDNIDQLMSISTKKTA